jgi:hypothetical protein
MPTLAGMSVALALLFAFGLFYALGREHGKRLSGRAQRHRRRQEEQWTPFDDFYSGR